MAVVGSTTLLEVGNKRVRGRLYPWGVVESELNEDYCVQLSPSPSLPPFLQLRIRNIVIIYCYGTC